MMHHHVSHTNTSNAEKPESNETFEQKCPGRRSGTAWLFESMITFYLLVITQPNVVAAFDVVVSFHVHVHVHLVFPMPVRNFLATRRIHHQ